MNSQLTFTRIEKILDHIHQHIREPLSLEGLAEHSCWSRWQLQRVFQDYTGFSVAQYVREIKLSCAAEALLDSNRRIMDIAMEYGFSSEITFSRSFKNQFQVSPKKYRANGIREGITTPLTRPVATHQQVCFPSEALYQVRLERKKTFRFCGTSAVVRGLLSETPDFTASVPKAWQAFFSKVPVETVLDVPHVALIDGFTEANPGELIYWTGLEAKQAQPLSPDIHCQQVPEQDYAVLPYQGPVADFHKSIIWLLGSWLPDSGYQGAENAFEAEVYYPPFDPSHQRIRAEYWLPIVSN